jgi:hypothetical protein
MKNISQIAFATIVLGFITTGLFAQIGPPPPPSAPLDGGAGVLLAVGVAYGVKKLYDSKRPEKKD